ncbi:hypothetical protein EDC04DRAFT_2573197 [Pisolithus marmoratus]|nr:hypothetical protein EDC04DRAFT_2573197 [Pisolithus marmoratus]
MAPTMVLDENRNIKLWYLPGAIPHIHQKNVWDSLNILRSPLEKSVMSPLKHGWRMDQVLFCKMADLKGSIDLLPAWYQQGHRPPDFHPKVSKLLKLGEEYNGVWQWVNQMSEVHALRSGMLAIIHPQMYSTGWEALIQLDMKAKQWKDADISSILPSWNAGYSSMLIMVNHTTPYHMDINGWEQWLDMLVTVGDYPCLDFVIPTFKLQFHYNPGTIIAMSGSALEHGVGYTTGNHTCLAYYMRHNVHKSVGIELCCLPNISDLQPTVVVNS